MDLVLHTHTCAEGSEVQGQTKQSEQYPVSKTKYKAALGMGRALA
jgi:hypothetical protein